MFEELGPEFEENLIKVATHFAETELLVEDDKISISVAISLSNGDETKIEYSMLRSYSTTIRISEQELQKWRRAYEKDPHFHLVLQSKKENKEMDDTYSQYHHSKEGLIYFEDSIGNT